MIRLVFMSKDVDRLSETIIKLSHTKLYNEVGFNYTPGLKIVGRQKDYIDSVSHSNAVSVLSSRAVWVYELELQSIYSDEYYIDLDTEDNVLDGGGERIVKDRKVLEVNLHRKIDYTNSEEESTPQ